MFDNSETGFMEISHIAKSEAEAAISSMYFIRPGFIRGFDPETNTVKAQIAIRVKTPVFDGKFDYKDHPVILKAPLVIPYSKAAGLASTVPIREGDPCLLLFSDRMIDMFWKTGEVALPEECGTNGAVTEPRQHAMSDAICIPGMMTRKQALQNWNNDRIEVRNQDRSKYISFGDDAIEVTDSEAKSTMKDGAVDVEAPNGIRLTDGTASLTIKDGKVSVNAPNGFYIDAPNFKLDDLLGHIFATFRAQRIQSDTSVNAGSDLTTSGGFSAEGHRHKDVETGGGTSGTYV